MTEGSTRASRPFGYIRKVYTEGSTKGTDDAGFLFDLAIFRIVWDRHSLSNIARILWVTHGHV
jgi:hypothetical protein